MKLLLSAVVGALVLCCCTRDAPGTETTREIRSVAGGATPTSSDEAVVRTDAGTLASQNLELLQSGGLCVLRLSGAARTSITLVPTPPCYFLRRQEDALQSFAYPDVGVDAVAIVVGTPATEATRVMWNLTPDQVCGEETQGILIKAGQLSVTRSVHRGGVTCRHHGADEKEYYAFAHDG